MGWLVCVQFVFVVEVVVDVDVGDIVVVGVEQVVYVVVDYQVMFCCQVFVVEQMVDQFVFVCVCVVQFVVVDCFEVMVEGEVVGDFVGEYVGFVGCDVECVVVFDQGFEQFGNVVEYVVFVEIGDFEVFVVVVYCFLGVCFVEVVGLYEVL